MSSLPTLLVLVPGLPLLASVLTAVFGPRVLGKQSHWPTVIAFALSLTASVMLLREVAGQDEAAAGRVGVEQVVRLWTWASIGEGTERPFTVDVTLRADPLTAVMLVTVTLVSLLVAIYSIGYMHDDPGYWRFFTYISLFVFSMTMLVSVSNFALLYVFWEGVGLCSYLLIGFWYQKPEAAAAGKKAFLVNRVGDFAFALGLFLIWTVYGTLDFHDKAQVAATLRVASAESPQTDATKHDVTGDGRNAMNAEGDASLRGNEADGTRSVPATLGVLGQTRLQHHAFVGGAIGTAICLLLMLGACGKSAQLPLHVWLPDAMEGPTPVSALIHAATMVTAGVYLVARCTPLFMASPQAQQVVALIGGATALMAAIIAVTQTDLKRILAYSTISQLGMMFLGLGAGSLLGVTAGMFHLFTHAFFKALLFLGAGSVMHAMGGVIDIRRFGGLRRVMPVTYLTFLVGCLALAAFPGLSGFFSKDRILAAVSEATVEGHPGARLYFLLYVAASVTAFLTAFYTFRAFFLTFHGETRVPHEAGRHAHESPATMTVPLMILAVAAALVGAYFEVTHGFDHFLAGTPSLAYAIPAGEPAHEAGHFSIMLTSGLIAIAGIAAAWLLYSATHDLVNPLARLFDVFALYRLSAGKFFVDQIYLILVVWPLEGIAWLSAWFDRRIVDGLVDLVGLIPRILGASLRTLQGGLIQFYALAMILGLLILLGTLYL